MLTGRSSWTSPQGTADDGEDGGRHQAPGDQVRYEATGRAIQGGTARATTSEGRVSATSLQGDK